MKPLEKFVHLICSELKNEGVNLTVACNQNDEKKEILVLHKEKVFPIFVIQSGEKKMNIFLPLVQTSFSIENTPKKIEKLSVSEEFHNALSKVFALILRKTDYIDILKKELEKRLENKGLHSVKIVQIEFLGEKIFLVLRMFFLWMVFIYEFNVRTAYISRNNCSLASIFFRPKELLVFPKSKLVHLKLLKKFFRKKMKEKNEGLLIPLLHPPKWYMKEELQKISTYVSLLSLLSMKK